MTLSCLSQSKAQTNEHNSFFFSAVYLQNIYRIYIHTALQWLSIQSSSMTCRHQYTGEERDCTVFISYIQFWYQSGPIPSEVISCTQVWQSSYCRGLHQPGMNEWRHLILVLHTHILCSGYIKIIYLNSMRPPHISVIVQSRGYLGISWTIQLLFTFCFGAHSSDISNSTPSVQITGYLWHWTCPWQNFIPLGSYGTTYFFSQNH